jgi:hypothetical protein
MGGPAPELYFVDTTGVPELVGTYAAPNPDDWTYGLSLDAEGNFYQDTGSHVYRYDLEGGRTLVYDPGPRAEGRPRPGAASILLTGEYDD